MSYSSEVLADSPLLWWRLGESVGTTAADGSGNGRTGTYSGSGVTYGVTGPVTGDTAVTTNGTTGRVQSDATLDLSAFSAITVEFWLNVASYPGGDELLMETSANANSNDGAFYIDPNVSAGPTGNFDVLLNHSGGDNQARYPKPTAGSFHYHAVILRTATTTGAITARVDKVQQTMNETPTNSVPAFGNFTVNLMCRNAASLFLAGTVDEFAIYGSALSNARLDAHYDAATATAGASIFYLKA